MGQNSAGLGVYAGLEVAFITMNQLALASKLFRIARSYGLKLAVVKNHFVK